MFRSCLQDSVTKFPLKEEQGSAVHHDPFCSSAHQAAGQLYSCQKPVRHLVADFDHDGRWWRGLFSCIWHNKLHYTVQFTARNKKMESLRFLLEVAGDKIINLIMSWPPAGFPNTKGNLNHPQFGGAGLAGEPSHCGYLVLCFKFPLLSRAR